MHSTYNTCILYRYGNTVFIKIYNEQWLFPQFHLAIINEVSIFFQEPVPYNVLATVKLLSLNSIYLEKISNFNVINGVNV